MPGKKYLSILRSKPALLALGISLSLPASAIEATLQITDREIVEALTDIKAEFRVINQRFQQVDQRFQQIDQRFQQIDQRFEQVDQRFEQIDQRFQQIDQRFEHLQNMMLTLFSSLIVLIVALFGYIAWDRRTVLRPLEQRMIVIEQDLVRDMDIRNPEGSTLTRIIAVLKDMAVGDEKLARTLQARRLM